MKSLMNFYGQAIRKHKGDAKKMSDVAWAITTKKIRATRNVRLAPVHGVVFNGTLLMAPSYTNLSRTHYLMLSWRKSPCVWENDQRKLSECECRFFQGINCKSPILPLPCLNVSTFPVTSIIRRYKSLLMISIIFMITQRGHSQNRDIQIPPPPSVRGCPNASKKTLPPSTDVQNFYSYLRH